MSHRGNWNQGQQREKTRVRMVLNEAWESIYCSCNSGGILWEVDEGPFKGKTGCASCLLEQFPGAVQFEQVWGVAFVIGERIKPVPPKDPYTAWLVENYGLEGARQVLQEEREATEDILGLLDSEYGEGDYNGW